MTYKKKILTLLFLSFYILIYSQKEAYIHYTTIDGLPSNNVYKGFQDSKGYMWYGTDAGLSRFDGYSFKNFGIQDGLPDNDIFDMLEDKQGRIWFSSNNGNLGYLQYGEFHNSTNTPLLSGHDLNSYISCMYIDSKGNVWFGTRSNGIKYLDTNNAFHEISKNELLSYKNIHLYTYAIWENKDGDVYALTNNALENLTKKETIPLKDIGVSIDYRDLRHCEVLTLDNGELLLTENSNFYIIDKDYKKVLKKTSYKNLNATVLLLSKDSSGNIWAGNYEGVFKLNFNDNEQAVPVDFLNDLTISSRTEDSQGNIWFTSLEKGVFFKPSVEVLNYTVNTILPEEKVNAIDGNDKGELIIGQERYYSFIKDGDITSFNKDAIYGNKQAITFTKHIYDVFLNNEGEYIITSTTGIIVNKKSKNHTYPRVIRAAAPYKGDSIFMGFNMLHKVKITELDSLSKPKVFPDVLLNNLQITTIYWDEKDNSIWVGLIDGLLHIKDNKISKLSDKYPVLLSHITDIKPSNNNDGILVSTNGNGILLLHKNGSPNFHLTTKDGLSSDICNAILEDEQSKLWIATSNGLNKVIDLENKNISKYGISDGLLSNDINDIYIHKQKIWIATPEGLSMMDISKEKKYTTPIYITNTSVNGAFKDFNINNTLSYKENDISIDFAALDYNMGGEILYRYKVKENQDWNYTTKNSIEFSSLDSGMYLFVVEAKTKQGIWSKESATLNFKITKPWWETWWAIASYILIFCSIMYAFFQYESKKRKLRNQLLLEKKEALRFKELDKFKSDFFTNISHEIRTPLTLINGLVSDLDLSNNNTSSSLKDIQLKIKKQSNIITGMVDNVLDLAKMQSSDFKLQLRSTNISELIQKQYLNFEPLFKQKNILFTISDHIKDDTAQIDIVYFERAINNIIINALKYTSEGEVSITASTINKYIQLIISDTGIGIPKNDIKNVFNRFYQVNNDINRSGGSGVGLAFSKEIIELHNGELLLESNLHKGSTFIIKIPINKKIYSSVDDKVCNTISLEKREVKIKPIGAFLIVDDNDDMRQYLISILKDYNCIEATNGIEALEILKTKNIDFIITDYMMPNLNGYEFVVKLKEDNTRIPVIMLTARTDTNTKLSILKLGVDDYITKPFDKEELLTRIYNCVRNYSSRNRYNEEYNIQIKETDDTFFEELKEYIYKNSNNPSLNQNEIAEMFNISKSSFYRKIKSHTGLTPNNFIKEIRLQKARDIIEENPDILVKQVALEVGFKHSAYFSKIYVERFGKKPVINK